MSLMFFLSDLCVWPSLQRKGVRVSVVSSIRTSPPMVADELRRQADQFLELADIAPEFTRRQTERS